MTTLMMNLQDHLQETVKGLVLLVALVFSFTLPRRKQLFVAAVPL